MTEPALDKFGKLLMESLRDRTLDYYEGLAQGRLKGSSVTELQEDLKSLSEAERDIVRRCIQFAIDGGLHDFLFNIHEIATDDNSIQLIVDGHDIMTLSDGLSGELYSQDGWIARYSKHK